MPTLFLAAGLKEDLPGLKRGRSEVACLLQYHCVLGAIPPVEYTHLKGAVGPFLSSVT